MTTRVVGYIKAVDLDEFDKFEWYNVLGFDIEKVNMNDHVKGSGRFCPALKKIYKNVYQVRCPFDLHLKHHFMKDGTTWVEVLPTSGIQPDGFNQLFGVNNMSDRNDPKHPIIQMKIPSILISDDDIELELLPPLTSYSKLPGIVAGGVINIYKWHRILNWFFEWHDTDKPIIIKRGDPLLWLKFVAKDRDDKVIVKKIKQDKDMEKSIRACQQVKYVYKVTDPNTWNLNLKNRKKYLIKSHIRIILERLHLI